MKCHGSKFLLVLILTFAVGVGVVRVWQNFINPLNPTQTNNLPVPTKTIEFQQSIYQPRQRSCEEIKNWQGEFAPKKHTIKGGVLNWEACLIEPIYPQEAIENKVDGQVNVEVLVDGYGKVKTAKAVSGNAGTNVAARGGRLVANGPAAWQLVA